MRPGDRYAHHSSMPVTRKRFPIGNARVYARSVRSPNGHRFLVAAYLLFGGTLACHNIPIKVIFMTAFQAEVYLMMGIFQKTLRRTHTSAEVFKHLRPPRSDLKPQTAQARRQQYQLCLPRFKIKKQTLAAYSHQQQLRKSLPAPYLTPRIHSNSPLRLALHRHQT